tara:strand:+ start:372 stop:602 length:231 start_codon:yes stop_codon:yes gene_type:complete
MVRKENIMKLSDEALGAIMMALQKSLMEQSDIVPVLKGFKFEANEKEELMVMNPPLVKMNNDDYDTLTSIEDSSDA